MLRKTLLIALMLSMCFFLIGCKKKSTPAETTEDVVVKTQAEYQAEAEKEITPENMEAELDTLEKAMETDLQQE
ncbi:MAG: hypothetical protein ACYSSP_07590 [Planctomycetota bacterium]|jgi:hypothetical protein